MSLAWTPESLNLVLTTPQVGVDLLLVTWVIPSSLPIASYPLVMSLRKKNKSVQEEQHFSQKLVMYNWISSFIKEKLGQGG